MSSSILDNNSSLVKVINEITEVSGYLWQKGWAERNGGNITVNITAQMKESEKKLPAISNKMPIGQKLNFLRGCYFYCKGKDKRLRDLARFPMENGSIIRILDDCEHYEIIADKPVIPTSELPSHLAMHNYLIGKGKNSKAVIHTHPTELIAMSHNKRFLEKDVLSKLLWSMTPETRIFCPRGVGIVPYLLLGSVELAKSTVSFLDNYDVVMWEKHGVCASGKDVSAAFDAIDVLNKSAQIYLASKSMGFEPEGINEQQMDELRIAFNLPTHH